VVTLNRVKRFNYGLYANLIFFPTARGVLAPLGLVVLHYHFVIIPRP